MFSTYLGVCGGGGGAKGSRAHDLLVQFCGLGSSKMEISETDFFHILTIQNDQVSHIKHVLDPLRVFFILFGCGGGGDTKGSRAHNLLMQFSGLGGSKMEFSETDFFHTLTIQNDQLSHVKHVLAPIHVFFTLFGCGWGGALLRGLGHTTCLCSFPAPAAQKWKFPKLSFLIL